MLNVPEVVTYFTELGRCPLFVLIGGWALSVVEHLFYSGGPLQTAPDRRSRGDHPVR